MQTDVGNVSPSVNKQTARHPNGASLVENIKVMTFIKWKKTDYRAATLTVFRITTLALQPSPGEMNSSDRSRYQGSFFISQSPSERGQASLCFCFLPGDLLCFYVYSIISFFLLLFFFLLSLPFLSLFSPIFISFSSVQLLNSLRALHLYSLKPSP